MSVVLLAGASVSCCGFVCSELFVIDGLVLFVFCHFCLFVFCLFVLPFAVSLRQFFYTTTLICFGPISFQENVYRCAF